MYSFFWQTGQNGVFFQMLYNIFCFNATCAKHIALSFQVEMICYEDVFVFFLFFIFSLFIQVQNRYCFLHIGILKCINVLLVGCYGIIFIMDLYINHAIFFMLSDLYVWAYYYEKHYHAIDSG